MLKAPGNLDGSNPPYCSEKEGESMNLKQIVEQLESCNYECEAGPLVNNVAFIALKEKAKEEQNGDE